MIQGTTPPSGSSMVGTPEYVLPCFTEPHAFYIFRFVARAILTSPRRRCRRSSQRHLAAWVQRRVFGKALPWTGLYGWPDQPLPSKDLVTEVIVFVAMLTQHALTW